MQKVWTCARLPPLGHVMKFCLLMHLYSEHESLKWEVEDRQLRERHLMSKSQLKETFFLQRSQMVNRHEKVRC